MQNKTALDNTGSHSSISLRKGNFRFGFEKKTIYQTTSQLNFTDKWDEAKKNKLKIVKEKKTDMTQSMYGHSKPSYQTMNEANFTAKDISASYSDNKLMKERGKALKQSNFSFGNFETKNTQQTIPTSVYEHAKQFHLERAKQSQLAKQRGIDLK